jgi:hypothetical protein
MIDPIEAVEAPEPSRTGSTFNGVRLSTRVAPATDAAARGSWCEMFTVSGDVIALSLGQIRDRGLERFAAMVATRRAIRDAAYERANPAQIIAAANRVLRQHDSQETATALFALLNTRERSLSFANAGHAHPLMAGPLGTLFLEFPTHDGPLGAEAEMTPALHEVSVPAATLFVMYTDYGEGEERMGTATERKARLRDATAFAYRYATVPAPPVAAILTAWTPNVAILRKAHARRNAPSAGAVA